MDSELVEVMGPPAHHQWLWQKLAAAAQVAGQIFNEMAQKLAPAFQAIVKAVEGWVAAWASFATRCAVEAYKRAGLPYGPASDRVALAWWNNYLARLLLKPTIGPRDHTRGTVRTITPHLWLLVRGQEGRAEWKPVS